MSIATVLGMQEAVLSLSSGEGSAKADSQQAFLKEVVVEMEAYRSKFEPLLSQLSSFDSPEATQLMSRALETMDVINNIINLQDEVGPLSSPHVILHCALVHSWCWQSLQDACSALSRRKVHSSFFLFEQHKFAA